MNEEKAPFDFMGVLVTCHGQQLVLNQSSPGVCLVCRGVMTITACNVNFARPPMIQTATDLPR